MLDQSIIREVIASLKANIVQVKVNVKSAFAIIAHCMEILDKYKTMTGEQKKLYVLAVVEDLAKGSDGIAGTQDDLIPVATVQVLTSIVRENVLQDFINIIIDATKGNLDINKIVKTSTTCFKICCFK